MPEFSHRTGKTSSRPENSFRNRPTFSEDGEAAVTSAGEVGALGDLVGQRLDALARLVLVGAEVHQDVARVALLDRGEARVLLGFVDGLEHLGLRRGRRRELVERELDVGHAQALGRLEARGLLLVAFLDLGVGHLDLRQVAAGLERRVGQPALLLVDAEGLRGRDRAADPGVRGRGPWRAARRTLAMGRLDVVPEELRA